MSAIAERRSKVGRVAVPAVLSAVVSAKVEASRKGSVPNAPWPVVSLGHLLREPLRNGHSAKAAGTAHGVRTLTLTAVTRGDFSEKNTKITSADPNRVSDLWLEPGDILIQRSNAPDLVGTTRLYRGPRHFAIFPDLIIRARLNETANPSFVELVLQSKSLRQYFKNRAKGMSGSMPKIDQQTISEAPIPLPPIPEQRRIVAEIEKQFTRLDAGVAALRRTQANLKRYRAAVLKAACEGRLVPTEAELAQQQPPKRGSIPRKSGTPDFESGETLLDRILSERRKKWQGRGKYKEAAAPETSKLTPLPNGWIWANVEQLGEVQLGRQRSPKNISKNYPTKYIRAANITERGIDVSDVLEMEFSPAERERFTLRTGDIVLSEASGSPSQVGKPAIWQDELPLCCFQNTVLRLRPAIIGARYVLLVFQHLYVNSVFAKVAGGVGINHLGAEKFSAIPFPLPPLAEQKRIVAEVERRLSVVEELEAVVSTNLQRATRLRESILSQSFSTGSR